jgi:hypothetical protein
MGHIEIRICSRDSQRLSSSINLIFVALQSTFQWPFKFGEFIGSISLLTQKKKDQFKNSKLGMTTLGRNYSSNTCRHAFN